jgi:hypothetical protein
MLATREPYSEEILIRGDHLANKRAEIRLRKQAANLSHVDLVSRDFPEAIFHAEHWNLQASSASRTVIRAGEEIRSVYDGSQRVQAYEWVLPNIFAAYLTEYELGLEFGSLWDQWLNEMQSELADLKAYYAGSAVAEQQGSDE